jgi:hypothetical protein
VFQGSGLNDMAESAALGEVLVGPPLVLMGEKMGSSADRPEQDAPRLAKDAVGTLA